MSYTEYLMGLLRPLGVYNWSEGTFQRAELTAFGQALDACAAELELVQREMLVSTAEDAGLTAVEALLPYRPVTDSLARRRTALAALLRIGGDSFTPQAINDTLSGCGVPARAEETGVGKVRVTFPGIAGVPPSFEERKKIIEEILPAHVEIEYWFWYLTWAELEEKFSCWQDIEDRALTWEGLETCVD